VWYFTLPRWNHPPEQDSTGDRARCVTQLTLGEKADYTAQLRRSSARRDPLDSAALAQSFENRPDLIGDRRAENAV